MPISGLLALVQPDLPRSPSGLRVLRNSDPELAKQLEPLWQLCARIATLDAGGRKDAFVKSLLGSMLGSLSVPMSVRTAYIAFAAQTSAVREAQANIARRYMPADLAATVIPKGQPSEGVDPVELLLVGFSEISRDGNVSEDTQRRAFEARRDLILAYINWDLRRTRRISKRYTDHDREAFLNALKAQDILLEIAEPSDVLSLHDPRDSMRTVWVEYFNGKEPDDPEGRLIRKSNQLTLGKIRLASGRIIPIAIEFRSKGFLPIIAKMIAVQGKGIQDVEDRRGMRFLYASVEDMKEGAAFIRRQLPLADSLTGKEVYRDTTDVNTPLLPFVARNFPMISFYKALAGKRVQLQNFAVMHHLDLVFAQSPDNHEIYKLRKYARSTGLFFWLFPPAIYKVRWNDGTVFAYLANHVLASLRS